VALLRAVAGVALGCALSVPAHAQQTTSGQIYIAGPGDRTGSDAATMTAMMQKPTAVQASVAAPTRPAVPAGMISIPRPGEKTAAAAGDAASAPNVITIPGPGERPVQAANASLPVRAVPPAPVALQRVSFAPAANRVAPVVVNAQPAVAQPAVPLATAGTRPATVAAAASTSAASANPYGHPGVAVAAALPAPAQPPVPSGQQDGDSVRATALAYLQQQSAGLPGHVTITVAPVFPRGLAACTSLEPFMPPGARMWGRTTVGVRCIGAKPWTLYVQARVAVQVTYYTAARPIGPGETLAAIDLQPRDGDLASLPQTVITDPTQALGAVSLERIAAGLPLRTDMLRSASSVVIGQTVRLVANGPNFTISTEGSVLNNAAPGQQVQVRTGNGQIVSGVVKDAGTVQVQI
jgi:flagella basal body P-ring formation protein FlgA